MEINKNESNYDSIDNLKENENKRKKKKIGLTSLGITVEPMLFAVYFIQAYTTGITIDLLQSKVCHMKFNLSSTECLNIRDLENNTKATIEAMTANVSMINNVAQNVIPTILTLFVGTWSDSNGRKPFMKWVMTGAMMSYFLWGSFTFIPNINVLWFVLPMAPLSFAGGWMSALLNIFSYIADIYEEHERPFRLSILMFCGVCGSILGNVMSSTVFYTAGAGGFQAVFFTAAAICGLTVIYVVYGLEESVVVTERVTFFDLNHISSIIVALLVKPRHSTLVSVLTITLATSEMIAFTGDREIIYLVGKSSFNWSLQNYNVFIAVTTTIAAISPIIGVKIFKEGMKWSNYSILAFFSCLMMTMYILSAVSVNEIMFWVFYCILKLAAILPPFLDCELSMIVKENDLGKAFAFCGLLDALSPFLSIPLFTQLYKYFLVNGSTLQVFYLKAVLSSITCISSLTLLILYKYKRQYWKMETRY